MNINMKLILVCFVLYVFSLSSCGCCSYHHLRRLRRDTKDDSINPYLLRHLCLLATSSGDGICGHTFELNHQWIRPLPVHDFTNIVPDDAFNTL